MTKSKETIKTEERIKSIDEKIAELEQEKLELAENIKRTKERRQVVIDFRGKKAPYFVDIRAITYNPNITEKGLNLFVMEMVKNVQSQYNLKAMESRYKGLEIEIVDRSEDDGIGNAVLVQVKIRNKVEIAQLIR